MNEKRMEELLKSLIRYAKNEAKDDFHAVLLLRLGIGFSMAELRELGETFPNFYEDLEKQRASYFYSGIDIDRFKQLYEK